MIEAGDRREVKVRRFGKPEHVCYLLALYLYGVRDSFVMARELVSKSPTGSAEMKEMMTTVNCQRCKAKPRDCISHT